MGGEMAMDTGIKADTSTFNFSSKEVSFDETRRHVGAINIIRGGRMNARRFAPPSQAPLPQKYTTPQIKKKTERPVGVKWGGG